MQGNSYNVHHNDGAHIWGCGFIPLSSEIGEISCNFFSNDLRLETILQVKQLLTTELICEP